MPQLLVLEDRLTPSTLPVTSVADNVNQPGTLRYDVAHAHSGDTILLTGAVQSGIVLTQGELLLKQNVTITSAGNHHIQISGDGLSRVFEVASGAQVSLSKLILTGGDGVASPTRSDPKDGSGGALPTTSRGRQDDGGGWRREPGQGAQSRRGVSDRPCFPSAAWGGSRPWRG
jgi:hypothetical protein